MCLGGRRQGQPPWVSAHRCRGLPGLQDAALPSDDVGWVQLPDVETTCDSKRG